MDNCMAVLEARLDALNTRLLDGFAARDKALDVALEGLTQQLKQMNEFRGAMSDQAARFITRSEHDALVAQINLQALNAKSIAGEYVPRVDMNIMVNRLDSVEKSQSDLHTRYAMVALLFSTGVVIANLVLVWWSHFAAAARVPAP